MALFRRAELPGEVRVAGRALPLLATRRRGARGIKLRADPTAGAIRLSLPARGGVAEALALLDSHADWLAVQVAGWPSPRPFIPGALIPFDGTELRIDWAAHHPRTPERFGETLRVGGPVELLPGRTLRWLRAAALADMSAGTRRLAATLDRPVSQVRVADPRARWGSCASGGRVAYSWRLILAPTFVRDAVVAHEVAHLVHANHGPHFHALLANLDPNATRSRAWLRRHGAALHWVGREPASAC